MTSRDHPRAAARCWERAGFFQEAAERFTTAEAWRDAGRCFSQAGRHHDAAVAYFRAGEPLLEAREHLMGSWPERARSLYGQLRSSQFLNWAEEVQLLLGLGEFEEATRIALSSDNQESIDLLARLSNTRGRPDLASILGLQVGEASWECSALWNRSLRRGLPPPIAEPPRLWPTVEFTEVSLVPIWEESIGGFLSFGQRVLDWSEDSAYFAAAFDIEGIIRARVGPSGIRSEYRKVPKESPFCIRFAPRNRDLLIGDRSGEVRLLPEEGLARSLVGLRRLIAVRGIAFNPQGDRVAVVAAGHNSGADLGVSIWPANDSQGRLEELQEPEGNCVPLACWSPSGKQLFWSPGPEGKLNRLHLLGAPQGPEPHGDRIHSLAFTADGRFLLSASADKTVLVRDGRSGCSVAPPARFADKVYGAIAHPQAALVAVAEGRRLNLLHLPPSDSPRFRKLAEHELVGLVTSLAFSPNGRFLLVMTYRNLHLFRFDLKP